MYISAFIPLNFWKHCHSSRSLSHGARWQTKNIILFRRISERQLSVQDRQKKIKSQVLWHAGFIRSPAVLQIRWGCSETDCQDTLRVGGGLAAAPDALHRHQLKTCSDTALSLKWIGFSTNVQKITTSHSSCCWLLLTIWGDEFATPVWLSCCPFFSAKTRLCCLTFK